MHELLQEHFAKMGARVRIGPVQRQRVSWGPWREEVQAVTLDVARDRRGEYFDIGVDERRVALEVLDVRPRDRHLLIMARHVGEDRKDKFLCGHDERAWFVAAVPPGAASNVRTALEALKPDAVHAAQAQRGVRARDRKRRRNAAYIRQGEWFFVPAPDVRPPPAAVLPNEPLARAGGKPHVVEWVYRTGGETVYVSSRRPNGLTEAEYGRLLRHNPSARAWDWRVMRRNPGVYAKGHVRHPDHKTIVLREWCQVHVNTEYLAPARRDLVFLD